MNKPQSIILAVLFTASINSITANAVGFNCKNPELSATEKIICTNEDLSNLDDELNNTFKALLSESSEQERKNILKEQHQWITETREKCIKEKNIEQQTSCLLEAYRSRNADLNSDYTEARSDNMLNKELPELSNRSGISAKEIKETLSACDSSQLNMNRCSGLFSLHIEIAMESALDEKLKSLPASCRDQLKAAQAKWKAELNDSCYESANESSGGGSMTATLANMCIESSMKTRVAQLRSIKSCNKLPN